MATINIGDKVEVFYVDEDGNEHIDSEGEVRAIFTSYWNNKTVYVFESIHCNDPRLMFIKGESTRIRPAKETK